MGPLEGPELEGPDQAAGRLGRRLRAGEHQALAEAFERYADLVYTIARRTMGNQHDAEDITQQVFVSAWRSRHTLVDDERSLAGWLTTITKRRCSDALTAASGRAARDAQILRTSAVRPALVDPGDRTIDNIVIAHALEQLGEPRASVVRLVVIEDLSHEQVADRLNLPLGTVKSHVRRGLLQLRDRLSEVNS